MPRDSHDTTIRDMESDLKFGRKWDANPAVTRAKSRAVHAEIVGAIAKGRQGVGCKQWKFGSRESSERQREMILNEIHSEEEEARTAHVVQQAQHSLWTTWHEVEQRKLRWTDL